MSKQIIVTEVEVKAALKAAKSQEVKDVLAALFCKPENKPNLDDYKSIKSYEDACEALGCKPTNFDTLAMVELSADPNVGSIPITMPEHIKALMKLETISRALWGRNWEPKPDAEGKSIMWYPWFALWTKQEIEDRKDEFNGALLSAPAGGGAYAGFGFLDTNYRSSNADAYVGFRLCQETEEKATYFGQQFIQLWADYLAFNFTVGAPILSNNK